MLISQLSAEDEGEDRCDHKGSGDADDHHQQIESAAVCSEVMPGMTKA